MENVLLSEYEFLSKNSILPQQLTSRLGFKPKISEIHENFYCSEKRNPFSLVYINNAYFLFKVLKKINTQQIKKITEIGSGTSIVVDLALKYLGFNGNLQKVNLNIHTTPKFNVGFTIKLLKGDFFSGISDIESSDILIFNHSLDDLYMYLWSKENKIDYFTFTKDIREENSLWKEAIQKKKKYLDELKKGLLETIKKLKSKSFIIIRCHPSSYEVYHNQSFRINFHRNLALDIVNFISKNGFKVILTDSKKIDSRFELSRSFFILQKI